MAFNVVYIDDEEDLCELFEETFISTGVNITTFTDVTRLKSFIEVNPVDLFLIDFRMPLITGDELALQLNPKTPKALITGDIAQDLKYKFDWIVQKPYKPNQILEIFRNVTKNKLI